MDIIKKNNIKRLILKYQKLIPKNIIKRDLVLYDTSFDKANVIVGPRRCGKTYFLYDIINSFKNDFIYINFDDNLIFDITSEDLNYIVDISLELFDSKNIVFFFDEIQIIDGWEHFIISLLNQHYKVFISGSNAKLLSKNISTSLRGKSLPYLLLPFSFKEFINVKNIKLNKNWYFTDKTIEIKKQFKEFMDFGGFPEIVLSNQLELKNKLINNYFESVIYKDLIDRLNLKNIKLVDVIIKYLLNIYSNTFSISKFTSYLKSNKIPFSLEDVYNILYSLQDIFLLDFVREYNKSYKKSEISKSKVYFFDIGFIKFLSYEPNDIGRILENLVFIELFRIQKNIDNKNIFYYNKDGSECDFVIKTNNSYNLIQVTYLLDYNNKEREINGLLEAMDFFKIDTGTIITYDQDEIINIKNKTIVIVPIWKWLLDKK